MSEVNDYLTKLDPEQKAQLEKIRQFVKQEVPDAVEVISYGMPGFKYKNHYLLGYAAFKDHLSLFPTSQPIAELDKRLAKFKTSKGTLQFTKEDPIPEPLIKEILESRVKSISK